MHGASLAAHSSSAAVARAGIEPGEIQDVLLGSARCEGAVGPVFAVPKLIDWLGIDPEKLNFDGGAISVGHPFGATGSRMTGHALLAGKRLGTKNAVVTLCIGGGMGAAALFEIA